MIEDLLPRYYEAHKDDDTRYTIIQSAIIRGHEVAYMDCRGTILAGDQRGTIFTIRMLFCECDFNEGIGWKIDPKYGITGLGDTSKCPDRRMFIRRRHAKLRKEFLKRFGRPIRKHIPEIILAMIEKVKAGEFVEDGIAAGSYGGYFYLQVVASIVNGFSRSLHGIKDFALQMVAEKKISLNGNVVTDYHEPSPSAWNETFRIEKSGWTVIAYLPAHEEMDQFWKFEILDPDGKNFNHSISDLPFDHAIEFGPNAEDLRLVKEELGNFLDQITKKS